VINKRCDHHSLHSSSIHFHDEQLHLLFQYPSYLEGKMKQLGRVGGAVMFGARAGAVVLSHPS
jgi:hypothetical protein